MSDAKQEMVKQCIEVFFGGFVIRPVKIDMNLDIFDNNSILTAYEEQSIFKCPKKIHSIGSSIYGRFCKYDEQG